MWKFSNLAHGNSESCKNEFPREVFESFVIFGSLNWQLSERFQRSLDKAPSDLNPDNILMQVSPLPKTRQP